jgi:hypothetical protein
VDKTNAQTWGVCALVSSTYALQAQPRGGLNSLREQVSVVDLSLREQVLTLPSPPERRSQLYPAHLLRI